MSETVAVDRKLLERVGDVVRCYWPHAVGNYERLRNDGHTQTMHVLHDLMAIRKELITLGMWSDSGAICRDPNVEIL